MFALLLMTTALFELGQPWDELDLDNAQQEQVLRVMRRYRPQIDALEAKLGKASKTTQGSLKRRIAQLEEKRDTDACRFLNDEQQQEYDQIRRWMAEGVPLGDDLYRSYEISETGPLEDGAERPNKIHFSITNRANHAVRDVVLDVHFIDRTGALIHTERQRLDHLEPGETRSVVVHYQYVRQWRQRYSRPRVDLISLEAVP